MICYDAPGLKEKVDDYIAVHPDAFKTAEGVQGVIELLSKHAINPETWKADVYDTDTAFAAGLIGAPPKDQIMPGKTFIGAKKKETVKAFKVMEGVEFEGPTKHRKSPEKTGHISLVIARECVWFKQMFLKRLK